MDKNGHFSFVFSALYSLYLQEEKPSEMKHHFSTVQLETPARRSTVSALMRDAHASGMLSLQMRLLLITSLPN